MDQRLYNLTPSQEEDEDSSLASRKCGTGAHAGIAALIALLVSLALFVAKVEKHQVVPEALLVAKVEEHSLAPEPHPSLFCFVLALSDSYEVLLLKQQFERGAGVFGCDNHSVFSDTGWPLGSEVLRAEVLPGPLHVAKDPQYNFALNARVFLRAWGRVLAHGAFALHDWTVKADPDTVFLPVRLRERLRRVSLPREGERGGLGVWIPNCRLGFRGALEVLSRRAVEALGAGLPRCRVERAKELDTEGEDTYLEACLDLLGVGRARDFGLLSDENCEGRPFPCVSGVAAFHPLKRPDKYLQCLEEAGGRRQEAASRGTSLRQEFQRTSSGA